MALDLLSLGGTRIGIFARSSAQWITLFNNLKIKVMSFIKQRTDNGNKLYCLPR